MASSGWGRGWNSGIWDSGPGTFVGLRLSLPEPALHIPIRDRARSSSPGFDGVDTRFSRLRPGVRL